jgi:membrane-bound metal-dependent hydrolase YbcI (DUF457 family)
VLGESHALSGAVTGTAAGLILHAPLPVTATLAVLGAAWATVPDLDTCGSCAARSLGFLSEGFAWTVGKVARGHRHGTHSLLGIAVLTAVTWLACEFRQTWPGRAGLMLLLAVALAAGARALRLGGHLADVLALGAAAAAAFEGWDLRLIPLGCAVGCSTHVAGDMLTESGCPLLWPFSQYRFKWWPRPLAFTTGTAPERMIIDPLLTAALAVLGTWAADPARGHVAWHAVTALL